MTGEAGSQCGEIESGMDDEAGYPDIDGHAAEIQELQQCTSFINAIINFRIKILNGAQYDKIQNDILQAGRDM